VHVVDLDAARRSGSNRDLVVAVAAAVPVPVQTGGGVRDGSLLAAGISRVVIGSAAVEDPPLVAQLGLEHPGRIAVGLDHRDGEVRTRGWEQGSGQRLVDVMDTLGVPGVAAFVVTDIARDGVLSGPDVSGYEELVARTSVPVIASGGVGSLDDLRALADVGLAGAIVGKALYEGRFTVQEAVAACAR
jgi:phosphoribosylformimino-5-aminoimidazole carboxamide ribotide isomerase